MWQIWIDRGGTFTDLVAKNPDGELVTHKLLSENPEQYEDAALQGIRDLLGLESGAPIPPGTVESVKMGTTVATNALLERKGDRTLLVITSGFGDVLRIGYQNRPRLFDMHIKLPELVYEQVIEADERVSAEGDVLKPLQEDQLRNDLQKAYDDGILSVAIAFMHGYRHNDHEQRAGEIAKEIGFTQISVSHTVSPLIKLVSRGDTTVVDAYLSPILRRYVDRVAADLEADGAVGPRLMFMQSNGGLTDAKIFQGKDSILSGPAGGVVGMVRTAQMAGFEKIIGFDMGGTSTDVAHFDGEYERTLETVVAGVRMRAPMMHIHTVAAGGGSILQFDGARFRVGPESAGANPGPACYRRGGPLAVTDCNVMLGKIQPEFFPSVFGPNADERLDADVVRQKFADLAQQIADATGEEKRSPEDVAEGFLTIAIENMANAIKQISVQRGYDVTEYVLNSFGGAGGQHACLVADALGMKTVLLHQFAGVLSAYGMGLADIRALREQTAQADLTDEALVSLNATLDDMAKDAVKEVSAQGLGDEKIDVYRRIHLRYDGTDSIIVVDLADAATMKENFEALHRQRFGFVPEGRKLVVEALAIEAVGITESTIDPEIEDVANRSAIQPISSVTMHSDGKNHETPVYSRDSFFPGDSITGPAIIAEDTGTTIVEPDWQASMNNRGHMILKRIKERPQIYAIGTKADPVLLEVFNNLFMSIAEQMGATLANTAYSVNIKERLDFSCAIFDIVGNLVANAPHMPIHLGSMGESIKTVIRENADTIKPGNVYALNAPYNGGTHLPDVTIITPVFDNDGKDILFYVGSRGHQADIGGRTPGSAPPDSTSIHEEGVLIDNFLLVEEGRLREKETYELLGSGQYPCRNPSQNMADLIAQIAANETGVRELRKMIDHFGLDVVHAYMGHVQDNAEESVRRVLDVLSDCEFTYPMDNGDTIQVKISVDKAAREALIDFTGTSPQGNHNYNAPLAVCKAAVLYVFRTLVDDEIPLNEGCLKPLKIKVPKKSIISPEYPAAVIAGNTEVSQCITDTLYGALGVIASAQGTMNNFVYGNDVYQNYETICGGTGAGPDFDGTDAVHSHMTNTRLTDIEVLENRFPVRVEEFSIRRGSGGEGAHTGGAGVVRKMRFLEGMTATILSSHRHTDPYGLKGGGPGKRGNNTVVRTDGTVDQLRGNDETEMAPGDVFVIETPGGGGFGAK
jgi:5-oxoprolinase (ATP-hydrolysing)